GHLRGCEGARQRIPLVIRQSWFRRSRGWCRFRRPAGTHHLIETRETALGGFTIGRSPVKGTPKRLLFVEALTDKCLNERGPCCITPRRRNACSLERLLKSVLET